jgi:hypothetical protein
VAQGYAYPVGASASQGAAKTVTVSISSADTPVTIFTATQKTQVSSVLATNVSGGILPVTLLVNKGSGNTVVAKSRVLKTQYLVLELVSGDSRVAGYEDDTLTEFTMAAGDVLYASCPVTNAINITVNLGEGVK